MKIIYSNILISNHSHKFFYTEVNVNEIYLYHSDDSISVKKIALSQKLFW